jgi:hypothetical protein
MERNLASALEQEGLPLQSPVVVQAIQSHLAAALEADPSVDFTDPHVMHYAAKQARREVEQVVATALTGLDAPGLRRLLGEKHYTALANIFRQGEVAALKTRAPAVAAAPAAPPPEGPQYLSRADVERRMIAQDNAEARKAGRR